MVIVPSIWTDLTSLSQMSGGTGITPFYQLIHEELIKPKPPGDANSMTSKTRFTLLHASRSAGDLPPPTILGSLTSTAQNDPSRLRLKLFVDDEDSLIDDPYDLTVGRIDKKALEDVLEIRRPSMWDKLLRRKLDPKGIAGDGRRVLVLVCGPDP